MQFPKGEAYINICKSLNEDIIDTLKSYRKSIIEGDFDSNTLI